MNEKIKKEKLKSIKTFFFGGGVVIVWVFKKLFIKDKFV